MAQPAGLPALAAVSNDTGGVRVVVKPKSVAAGSVWEFDVTMETHTKPLDSDLTKAAVIVDDAMILEDSLAGAVRALQLADVTAISARVELRESTLAAVKEAAGGEYFESFAEAAAWIEGSSSREETR